VQYSDAEHFGKSFTTHFFPVGGDVRAIVADWVHYLRGDKLWGGDDPLFQATLIEVGATRPFESVGIAREHWTTASPIRPIFRQAFESAGRPYFNPHSFRGTLVQLGRTMCRDPEQLKAWSQNLGHSTDRPMAPSVPIPSTADRRFPRETAERPPPIFPPPSDGEELARTET